eukprot:CAMPEP_0202361682 /NCGR_PEP_ID=MMETSP1126-20121109/14147_1 /ASSEMBLY_ACC=CAM_ASM_000457 /TAXON_ID=3047 /ORGANISM="Dunaliella tertiolecta, Strain CCMP1320" /LENGTH=36 /DNA_ID= /DNA_START= /DNA_END= /DNA_ORIENTATION=
MTPLLPTAAAAPTADAAVAVAYAGKEARADRPLLQE